MDYSKAVEILQDHTGLPLLESLELLQHDEDEFDLAPPRVQAAFHSLMVGFTQLFLGAA